MLKKLKRKPLWIHLLIVVLLTTLVVIVFFGSLDFLTKHGAYQKVPNIVGKNIDAARQALEDAGFEVEIQDSLYIDSLPKLAVIKQSPEGEATVKVNRTIYLTVNRAQPPLVEMPNLVGFSIRNAEMYLENLGLHLGDTTFRPDIAKNAVLEQLYNGEAVKAGTKIYMGSAISFVLGDGVGNTELVVPNLVGKRYSDANQILRSMGVNVTAVFAIDVTDSANAYVTRQDPTQYRGSGSDRTYNRIKPGQSLNIWLGTSPATTDTTATENLNEE